MPHESKRSAGAAIWSATLHTRWFVTPSCLSTTARSVSVSRSLSLPSFTSYHVINPLSKYACSNGCTLINRHKPETTKTPHRASRSARGESPSGSATMDGALTTRDIRGAANAVRRINLRQDGTANVPAYLFAHSGICVASK